MLKTIEIRGNLIERKEKNIKFVAFLAKKKDGTWATIKFTKDCENAPTKEGRFDMIIDTENLNRSTDDFGREVWWAKNRVESVSPHVFEDRAAEEF